MAIIRKNSRFLVRHLSHGVLAIIAGSPILTGCGIIGCCIIGCCIIGCGPGGSFSGVTIAASPDTSQPNSSSNTTDKKETPAAPKSLSTTSKLSKMNIKFNELSEKEAEVILNKGTERPWIGEYTDNKRKGTYICRRCNAPLYKSDAKFDSHCGWPSFDEEIPGTVQRLPDADGHRTEIVCKNCEGHLGHVFLKEGYTAKNTRHCVNSISMKFIPEGKELPEVIRANSDSKDDSNTNKADTDSKTEKPAPSKTEATKP